MNEKRIERKLTAVLVDSPATSQEGVADYKRAERAIRKLKREEPQKFRTLFHNYLQSIAAFDREITRQAQKEISAFDESFRRRPS